MKLKVPSTHPKSCMLFDITSIVHGSPTLCHSYRCLNVKGLDLPICQTYTHYLYPSYKSSSVISDSDHFVDPNSEGSPRQQALPFPLGALRRPSHAGIPPPIRSARPVDAAASGTTAAPVARTMAVVDGPVLRPDRIARPEAGSGGARSRLHLPLSSARQQQQRQLAGRHLPRREDGFGLICKVLGYVPKTARTFETPHAM